MISLPIKEEIFVSRHKLLRNTTKHFLTLIYEFFLHYGHCYFIFCARERFIS